MSKPVFAMARMTATTKAPTQSNAMSAIAISYRFERFTS
jgi:hypothetical protein